MQSDPTQRRSALVRLDGRWLLLLLVLMYAWWVWGGARPEDKKERWRWMGVLAQEKVFMDLYPFPVAQATLAQGGDPYIPNPADPWGRPYNYPRTWLWFMRFPADEAAIAAVGLGLALAALGVWSCLLGRLTPAQGIVAGLLWCSPAVMLGVERGNTDLLIFTFVAGGAILASSPGAARQGGGRALWFLAAVLKLFPVLVGWAWWRQAGRPRAWLLAAAVAFAAYLLVEARETRAALINTETGWVLSYGARVPAHALAQAWKFYGYGPFDEVRAGRVGTALALLVAGAAWVLGRRWRLPVVAEERHRLGLLAGGAIYLGTFLAGNSFNYRLIFLLLALPWLWRAGAQSGPVARTAVAALVLLPLAFGFSYLIAGWSGFVLKEAAGWGLVFCLAALLAAESATDTTEGRAP